MSELEQQLLAFYNEMRRADHAAKLNDPEALAQWRQYSWWSEEYPEPIEDFDELGWDEISYELDDVELDGYHFKSLESVGGEGEGDHMHWVFSITDPEGKTVIWKLDGYWVSHDGAYWGDYDPYQVTAKEKTVTYYE
jgi:hypothetical protein